MDTPKRLAGPTLITSAEITLYTAPTGGQAIIRSIHIVNTSGSAVTFKMSIGADAAATRLYHDRSIAAGAEFDAPISYLVLESGNTLRAQAATTNVLTATVSGVEVTP